MKFLRSFPECYHISLFYFCSLSWGRVYEWIDCTLFWLRLTLFRFWRIRPCLRLLPIWDLMHLWKYLDFPPPVQYNSNTPSVAYLFKISISLKSTSNNALSTTFPTCKWAPSLEPFPACSMLIQAWVFLWTCSFYNVDFLDDNIFRSLLEILGLIAVTVIEWVIELFIVPATF